MKNVIKVLALSMVVVLSVLMLVSCSTYGKIEKAFVDGGYTLSFGIVVSAYNVTGATPLICENGEVTPLNPEKTIFTKQAELLHNYVDIKVTGISAANNGAELVVCMFACDGEGVYYLNEKSQSTEAETVTINF
jgi:hypothetical protein